MKLATYLFKRLHQLGVRDVIGVPGDFNLLLLDFVEPAGLAWIGACNELNAGYAADGYARVRGASAMVTTFGVGELSAVNAVAGAYAERAPLVHIVGTPATKLQDGGARMHHTFNDGQFRRFAAVARGVTVAQAELRDAAAAPAEIDRVLGECLLHSRPVYIEVPGDMVEAEVDDALLQQKIPHPADAWAPPADELVGRVLDQLYAAKRAVVFVDGEARSMACAGELRRLVDATGWPALYPTFGKGILDDSLPNVLGLHSATFGDVHTAPLFDQADLVLAVGPHYSITNSYSQKTVPAAAKTLELSHAGLSIRGEAVAAGPLAAKHLLAAVLARLDPAKLQKQDLTLIAHPSAHPRPPPPAADAPIGQDAFYHAINPLLRAGDVVMGETGTPSYGTRQLVFPPGCQYFGATTWLSIGYMMPAAVGAALGRRALASSPQQQQAGPEFPTTPVAPSGAPRAAESAAANARVLLFMGDGSFQMTAQELSTAIHQRLPLTVFLIDNRGYTIERCLHGWRAPYNDVRPWRYAELARSFGGDVKTWKVATFGELQTMLKSPEFEAADKGVRFVEVVMPRDDAPEMLYRLTSRPPQD